jgi:hypothetical protein
MKLALSKVVSLSEFDFEIKSERGLLFLPETLGKFDANEEGEILECDPNPSFSPGGAKEGSEGDEAGPVSSTDKFVVNLRKRFAKVIKIFFICERARKSVGWS